MGDAELQNKMDHLKESIDTLDTTMTDVGSKIDITNARMSTLNTTITTMSSKIDDTNTKLDTLAGKLDTTNTKLDTLNTSITTLNTSITTLIASVDKMSSKMITPENVDEAIIGSITKFKFADMYQTTAPGMSTAYWGLTATSDLAYTFEPGTDKILKVEYNRVTGPFESDFATGATYTPTGMAMSSTYLFVCDNGAPATLYIYNLSDGSVYDTRTIGSPLSSNERCRALAYDDANSILYIFFSDSVTKKMYYAQMTELSGDIPSGTTYEISYYRYSQIQDAEVHNENLIALDYNRSVAGWRRLYLWRIGETIPLIMSEIPGEPNDFFAKIKGEDLYLWWWEDPADAYAAFVVRGFSPLTRVALEEGISSSELYGTGYTVNSAAVAQLLWPTQHRESCIVFNNSTTGTIYLGEHIVTAVTGFPVLPKCHIEINGFQGELWAIGSENGINVRVVESRG